MDLLVATRSFDKIVEIRRILGAVPGLRLIDLESAGIAKDAAEEELEPYETFTAVNRGWGKSNNWRIARAMTKDELNATDLGQFLESI